MYVYCRVSERSGGCGYRFVGASGTPVDVLFGMTRLSHPPTVPYVAVEREMLGAFLDAMRLVIRQKLEGVSDEQARAAPTTSSLSLLGIVKHLAWTECRWFRECFADEEVDDPLFRGDSSFEFAVKPSDTVESALTFYDEQCARSRGVMMSAASLEVLAVNRRFQNDVSLRWIVLHMIEETARHAGRKLSSRLRRVLVIGSV